MQINSLAIKINVNNSTDFLGKFWTSHWHTYTVQINDSAAHLTRSIRDSECVGSKKWCAMIGLCVNQAFQMQQPYNLACFYVFSLLLNLGIFNNKIFFFCISSLF